MIKFVATFLLLLPVSVKASEQPSLSGVDPAAITSVSVVLPSAQQIVAEGQLSEVQPPLTAPDRTSDYYFNSYVLKAVNYLNKNYGLKGYNIKAVLTHDIDYSDQGVIKATKPPQTMCVAAAMEVILTAYQIYSQETGDYSPYKYLPKSSYEKLAVDDIKGHIWVNHDFNSYGTADALINFGMGQRVKFESLKPGSFVNINRTTNTGHAVVFINYLNNKGEEQNYYNDSVIGFKYFSSQGGSEAGKGGFSYRYAIFSKYGCPALSGDKQRDCNVIYSENQKYLNTGMMLSPKNWSGVIPQASSRTGESVFDGEYFNGKTTDDPR